MHHTITNNQLIIRLDDGDREWLIESRGDNERFNDYFAMEPLTCNSELQWIDPADTGDLTDAPVLGILGDQSTDHTGPYGAVHIGHWHGSARYRPIVQRWVFMDYAIISIVDRLIETGEAVFVAE